ncbi:chemotaxis protein MotC [Phyllobacterium sp. SB3]|uniref:chemotaxis protein MotC n=1 Tax=Phyllobacterium sp. SB3 TaxID=3156073 RepID=UPI0032AEFF0E
MRARRYLFLLMLGLFGFPQAQVWADMPPPEPYLLVRSMRMLQDQVASGKPEALPMLNRVLAHISRQFKEAKPDAWDKPANAYALFIYLLNGGNPDVVRGIIATLKPDQVDPKLIAGSLAYADGDALRIVESFQELPPNLPTELNASIYLVTASQLASIDAITALKRLDYIRLNAPGTLLEEAALRRGLSIAADIGEKGKLISLARNYLQRFERSPYSEDFFRQLVDALLKLKGKVSDEEIRELAALAWPGARMPFYLRIARGSIVNGDLARARFASEEAAELAATLKADDTQAKLYLAVSNVGSDETGEASRILSNLPKDRLHGRDLKLLEAATAMAGKITAQPEVMPVTAEPQASPVSEISTRPPQKINPPPVIDTEDAMITETRKKLDAIDAILGKAGK